MGTKEFAGDRVHAATEMPEAAVAKLEALDDVNFPAIDGDLKALDACGPAWKQTVAELGPEVVKETRNEYIRYASSTWDFLMRQTVQDPLRLLAVMKIIGMMFGDDA
jgi:hypothetical protein